ncbi:MAG TPA: AAA family ATPase [Gemmataceae bacterium]|nr:AAA family ATPase [Gemmataceae bacterium]
MFNIDLPLTTVLQSFDHGILLGEALLFPEIRCLSNRSTALHRTLKNLVIRTTMAIPPFEVHRRRLAGNIEISSVAVTLSPPVRSLTWQEPVILHFPVVRWSHPAPQVLQAGSAALVPEAVLAYVPALCMEVLAARPDMLEALLPEQIRTALMRIKANALEPLVWLQRCGEIKLEQMECAIELKTPKQHAREEIERQDHGKPVLPEVAADLCKEPLRPGYELDHVIAKMIDALTGAQSRSVLLVGPSGAGKTASVHELVRRRRRLGLAATPFWATTGARLVSGMSGFGMWQERCSKVAREASHQRAILHFGNLLELMEVGKSEHQAQGIASFLRPFLARGDLLAIAECTAEQLPLIERQEPQLLATFVQIPVPEPSPRQSRNILESYVKEANHENPPITSDGIDQLDRLHRRYATYSAFPGRPLRFLRNLLADKTPDRVLTAIDVTREFARESGLPLSLLGDSERLNLEQTREWFAKRVIGQKDPVDLVVDLLAAVKAALTRPRKPVASLMFIGPTGVGKTEMAKALAEFLFGSTTRLTRFDMSEYADPHAVDRLIGGSFRTEGLLTARIREQPFSIVLLDEIEKAHPLLFDLLLQVLGEGRLTDSAGRVADFCNSVVIMTSNLGAENFQRGSFGLNQCKAGGNQARQHFLDAVQRFFRPELFNRIDYVIPFAPLEEQTILHIAYRQLELIRRRDGLRFRNVALDIPAEVAAWLAVHGTDVRYGARPLKRAMDRHLLAPLAEKLNGYFAETPLKAQVAVIEGSLHVHVKSELQSIHHAETRNDAAVVTELLDLRRNLQKLFRSPAALEMDNEIHRLQLLEKRAARGKRLRPDDIRRLSRLAAWRAIRADLHELFARVCSHEDEALLGLLGNGPIDAEEISRRLKSARAAWEQNLLKLYLQRFEKPDDVVVAIFSEQPAFLMMLGEAYFRMVLARHDGQAEVWQFRPGPPSRTKEEPAPLERRLVLDAGLLWQGAKNVSMRVFNHEKKVLLPEQRVARPLEGVVGLGLVIHAPAALPRFAGEYGLHQFRNAQASGICLVDTSELDWQDYAPPAGMDRRGNIGQQERRRLYDLARGTLEDVRLPGKLYVNPDTLPVVLADALEQCLARNLKEILFP